MLGLVATMIPLGPALRALGDGHMADVSRGLGVAFSAVILALVAASLTFWVVNVRRRWYAAELVAIEKGLAAGGQAAPVRSAPPVATATASIRSRRSSIIGRRRRSATSWNIVDLEPQ